LVRLLPFLDGCWPNSGGVFEYKRVDGAGALGSLGDAIPGREALAGTLPATCRGRVTVVGVAVAAHVSRRCLIILLAGHHAIAEDGWGCSGVRGSGHARPAGWLGADGVGVDLHFGELGLGSVSLVGSAILDAVLSAVLSLFPFCGLMALAGFGIWVGHW
jgi:hypothetical protein